MKINQINTFNATISRQNNQTFKTQNILSKPINFKGLLPQSQLNKIKMCVFDLDETLLEGEQNVRNQIMAFSKATLKNGQKRILVYSSSRPLSKVQPLIDNNTLIMPDYYVGNNGINIYKNENGKLVEIEQWSKKISKGFHKDNIRAYMIQLSQKHKFSEAEWKKIKPEQLPDGQKEFRGSKITEYEVFGSPSNIYFMMAPGIFAQSKDEISQFLASNKIKADIKFQNFGSENLKSLEKIFGPQIAQDMRNHALPRLNQDGSVDVAIISATSDKGKATEFIRKILKLKNSEIFAAGDDVNDFSHTNKGYFFALLSNATEGLKKLIPSTPKQNIIKTSKSGVDGIWEVIC